MPDELNKEIRCKQCKKFFIAIRLEGEDIVLERDRCPRCGKPYTLKFAVIDGKLITKQ